jgi:hypothetical protein
MAIVGAAKRSPDIQPEVGYNSSNCIYYQPSSSHTAALLVGLGDGSVRVITRGMTQTTFNLAMVPNDFQPLPSDW